jgi:NADPH2:quinone reductase
MTKAIRIHAPGGPKALKWEEVEVGDPGPGEVRLRQTAVGLNYIDVYQRTGLYPLPSLPTAIGLEGAGVVTAVGRRVTGLKAGDRVAYAGGPPGAYAEERVMPADRLVKVPDGIDDQTAAAMMLQGLTVQYLIRRTYRVKKGDVVLFHAAAGGVGSIACQWLRHLGARVVGTVGSDDKARLAKRLGCTWPVNYRKADFVAKARKVTGGEGVAVAYDSVGKDTYMGSMDSVRPLGTVVLFGNASGPVGPIDPLLLAQKGSLFLTRPTLFNYTAERADLVKAARELFHVVTSGAVKIRIGQAYALRDAARAHRDLEARKTTGSTILLP